MERQSQEELRRSRVEGTKLLCETITQHRDATKDLICASAIGFYGDRGYRVVERIVPSGKGFLAELCQEWEAACEPARTSEFALSILRFGVILKPQRRRAGQMLTPFKLGIGGWWGRENQYWSWIAIDDIIGAIDHCIREENVSGTSQCDVA